MHWLVLLKRSSVQKNFLPESHCNIPFFQSFVIGGYVNGSSQPHGSSSGSSSGATSPHREREVWGGPKSGDGQYQPCLPPVAAEVLRTAYERHRRGLMSPYMYQLLTQVNFLVSVLILFVFPSKKAPFLVQNTGQRSSNEGKSNAVPRWDPVLDLELCSQYGIRHCTRKKKTNFVVNILKEYERVKFLFYFFREKSVCQ